MIYALVQDAAIVQVGALPQLWFDGTRWHDWRDLDTAATDPAMSGWLPVTDAARPADTATATTDYSVDLVAGTPTVTWTPRPWTAEELAARAEQSARLDDLAARVARIEAHLWPAPLDPTVPDDPAVADWATLGGIWPDQGLLREGGIIWRNVSGVPLTTPPSGFPGQPEQWGHLFVAVLTPEPEPDPEPTVADFVQPTGAHDAYAKGARVRFDGKVYESKVDGNAYSPSSDPPNWLLIA